MAVSKELAKAKQQMRRNRNERNKYNKSKDAITASIRYPMG